MKSIRLFFARLSGFLNRGSSESDLSDEFRFHLETEVEYQMKQGLSREEAEALARRKFGGVEQTKEIYRDTRGFPAVEAFVRDLRLGVRALCKNPGFSVVAVLTLAIGMGGTAAIYTVLDQVVLSPLPYPEAERLVKVENQVPGVAPDEVWDMSTAQYTYLGGRLATIDDIVLYRQTYTTVETGEGPERVPGWRVSSKFFPLLGAEAYAGRLFGPEHDVPGFDPAVVLSHGFWQRRFGGDEAILGEAIRMNGRLYEVIGIVEPGVAAPEPPPAPPADVWLPQFVNPEGPFYNDHNYPMLARLAPGADIPAAEGELARLRPGLVDEFPNVYAREFFDRTGFRTQLTPLQAVVVGDVAQSLWILFASVGLVLLIACANVANLFMVRLDGRHREFAIRSALGAGRWSIARHLLAEGFVLAFAAGGLGLAAAAWGLPALMGLAPDSLPRTDNVAVDSGSVIFTLLASLAAGVFLAAYPLFRFGRGDRRMATDEGNWSTDSRQRQRVRAAFVVGQVALALTLIIGAGLLLESVRRLGGIDTGIDTEGVLTTNLYLMPDRYSSSADVWTAQSEILNHVREIPGVRAAGMTIDLPIANNFGCTVQSFEDQTVYSRMEDAGRTLCAGQQRTTPGYFEAMGIPVTRGRGLEDADNEIPTRASVVVSEAFADRFWPGENPLGKGVAPNGTSAPFYRVVGVVGDVPAGSLEGDAAIAVYYPTVNTPGSAVTSWQTSMTLVVQAGVSEPSQLLPQIRQAVRAVDPTIPLADTRTMEQIVGASMARIEFTTTLLGVAALVALLLSALGLYGVVSYAVSRRTREIGVRIAVGAGPGEVERFFVRKSMTLAAAGLAGGVLLALTTTRLLDGILYGVEPSHPATFASAGGILLVIALVASWIPARRAARVDPLVALRHN